MKVIPLLARLAAPSVAPALSSRDENTAERPIERSVLLSVGAAASTSTFITRIKNETSDDN
jgi:hypothetical protein